MRTAAQSGILRPVIALASGNAMMPHTGLFCTENPDIWLRSTLHRVRSGHPEWPRLLVFVQSATSKVVHVALDDLQSTVRPQYHALQWWVITHHWPSWRLSAILPAFRRLYERNSPAEAQHRYGYGPAVGTRLLERCA